MAISEFIYFRRPSWRSFASKTAPTIIVWAVLAWLAQTLWVLGPHTSWGPSLVGFVLPLLLLTARLTSGKRWRSSVCATLSFCLPACTLRLLSEFLAFGTGGMPEHPTPRLWVILEALAEFQRENAITTALGLLVLLCCFRSPAPSAERRDFLAATLVVLLATLGATALGAGILGALREPSVGAP